MKRLRYDPGSLRHRIDIERAAIAPDGAGGHIESWSMLARVFAAVEPIAARDRFGADQRLESVTHRVTIRFRGDVESGMRLRLGERMLNIRTVHDPDESGRYLLLLAEEEGR